MTQTAQQRTSEAPTRDEDAPPAAPHGMAVDRPALARLVGDTEEFAAQYWGQRPLLRSGAQEAAFADLFGLDAVDELVSVRGLRTPFLRLVKDGSELPERRYTGGGGSGAAITDQARDDSIHEEVSRGATLVLQGMHRMWEPLLTFSQQLSADLGHPVQVNAYITPPQSQGFGSHYDVHDVFVLQFAGHKRWHIHEPVFALPLRTQPTHLHAEAIREAAAGEPLLEVVLEPGDCLYLPRGYLHSATALGGVSGHLTIGLPAWTRHSVAEQVLSQVGELLTQDEELCASLPLGVDFGDPSSLAGEVEAVRAAVQRAVDSVDPEAVVAGLLGEHSGTQRPAPVRPFAQLAASADLTADTRVVLRGHLALRREVLIDGSVRLHGRNGRVTVPPSEVGALAELLSGAPMSAAALPPRPGGRPASNPASA